MIKHTKYFLYLFLFSTFITACSTDNNSKQEHVTNKEEERNYIKAPDFSADTAYNFIATQVAFGPRTPNSKAQKQCEKFIVSTLKKYNLTVIEQKTQVKAYDGKMLYCNNITGSIHPENTNRIFISGHWDSRHVADQDVANQNKPIEGANDGGSSAAVMLEMARVLSQYKDLKIGVDFIFFDCEDYGQPNNSGLPYMEDSYCLGSQYWSKNKPMGYQPRYGINIDMVGATNVRFLKDGTSLQYAYGVVEKVWQTAARIGYGSVFINKQSGTSLTDDHLYVNTLANIPCIDIIHHDEATPSNFPITWHTHNDNLQNIDKTSLKAVGQTLLEVVVNEK